MKKIVIYDEQKVEKAKALCESLCGCADNVSFSLCDDETAEAIDRVESGVGKILDDGAVIELDEIMVAWIKNMCDNEIENANVMIRQENLWALGSNTTEQSEIHVGNMARLEQYKMVLDKIKKSVIE